MEKTFENEELKRRYDSPDLEGASNCETDLAAVSIDSEKNVVQQRKFLCSDLVIDTQTNMMLQRRSFPFFSNFRITTSCV